VGRRKGRHILDDHPLARFLQSICHGMSLYLLDGMAFVAMSSGISLGRWAWREYRRRKKR
jgi:hypothetical protein